MRANTAKRSAAWSAALIACVAVRPALAAAASEERGPGSKQADAGAVAGIAVGALAAGPAGAVVGAGVGALLGDRYHRQAQSATALKEKLATSEAERARLLESVAQLDSSLAEEKARGEQLDATLARTEDLGLDVSFRTDDDSVTAQAMSPLLKLGALVASLPQAQVLVAGYADPRGSVAYNDALSLRRAECVAAVLGAAGVGRERIVIEAHGKSASAAQDGDLDAYAFERRVTVRVQLPSAAQVTRRE
jgi:outer membrane protein OmpA-like peptidoglycan-associated protein